MKMDENDAMAQFKAQLAEDAIRFNERAEKEMVLIRKKQEKEMKKKAEKRARLAKRLSTNKDFTGQHSIGEQECIAELKAIRWKYTLSKVDIKTVTRLANLFIKNPKLIPPIKSHHKAVKVAKKKQ